MPDKDGRFLGVSLSGCQNPWLASLSASTEHDDEPSIDTEEPEFHIEWAPPPELDGAYFTAE